MLLLTENEDWPGRQIRPRLLRILTTGIAKSYSASAALFIKLLSCATFAPLVSPTTK